MPVASIITSAKAAAKGYRLRVSIESIKQGIEASRLRPASVPRFAAPSPRPTPASIAARRRRRNSCSRVTALADASRPSKVKFSCVR